MAKFFVGQRVRKVSNVNKRGLRVIDRGLPIGAEGVIVRHDDLWDWIVRFPKYKVKIGFLAADEWRTDSCMLEPITDTWAQDKVAQLVKQCMPVAA